MLKEFVQTLSQWKSTKNIQLLRRKPKADEGIVVGTICLESPGRFIQDMGFFWSVLPSHCTMGAVTLVLTQHTERISSKVKMVLKIIMGPEHFTCSSMISSFLWFLTVGKYLLLSWLRKQNLSLTQLLFLLKKTRLNYMLRHFPIFHNNFPININFFSILFEILIGDEGPNLFMRNFWSLKRVIPQLLGSKKKVILATWVVFFNIICVWHPV